MTYGRYTRIAWAPPRLTWQRDDVPLEAVADLLAGAAFRAFSRHPRLSISDPATTVHVDRDGRSIGRDHEAFDALVRHHHFALRRDEVLWLELHESDGRVRVRVCAWPVAGEPQSFDAIASGPLAGTLSELMGRWLDARGLAEDGAQLQFDAFDLDLLARAAVALRELGAEAERRSAAIEAARAEERELELPPLDVPAIDLIPFYHAASRRFRVDLSERILALDPTDPLVRFQRASRARDLAALDALARDTPGWGRPLREALELHEPQERQRRALTAAALDSADVDALIAAGDELWNAHRDAEAYRVFDNASRLQSANLATHSKAMGAKLRTGRVGAAYDDILARFAAFPSGAGAGIFGVHPNMVWCRLRFANVLFSIGRIDEAIEVRERALASAFGNWSDQNEVLDQWKGDARARLHAYAREGFFRGDLGRTVAGAAAAPIDAAVTLSAFLHALIETGQPDLAVMAWHQHRSLPAGSGLGPDLIAVRALLEVGTPAEIPHLLAAAALRVPQAEHASTIDRILRASVAAGAQAWADEVERHASVGALRLARQLARDAADFLPDAGDHPQLAELSRAAAPFPSDPAWWSDLRERFGDSITASCDEWIGTIGDDLASADRAVATWTALAPEPEPEAPAERREEHVQRLLYILSRTLVEYLAATCSPPSPRAGALRSVANEALSMLASWSARFDAGTLTAFFGALEHVARPIAAGAGAWLVDRWALRVERALRLEDSWGGHLELITGTSPTLAGLLRGPERASLELLEAQDLAESDPVRAAALFERCVAAIGAGQAARWSDAVAASLGSSDEALDVHLLCVAAHPFNAGPAVHAATILLQRGQGARAFEVLVARLGQAGAEWRKDRVDELRPLLTQHLPVPAAFDEAQSQAFEAMQSGQMEAALAPLWWCNALDPGNETCLRNLGLASAMLGRSYDAMRYFSEANPDEGLVWAAQQLYQGGHLAASTDVYRFLTLGPVPPVLWQQCAGIAYAAEDDETCALAYGVLDALAPEALGGAELNAWAGVLDNLGEYQACARVAERLARIAGDDAMLASCADHHLACALLGLGRAAEALPLAERAIARNPLPDNAAVFAETAELCRVNGRRPPAPSRRTTPAGRARAALARGEIRDALETASGSPDWDLRRVALTASRYRYASEDDVRVPARALAQAETILVDSAGATELHASLARAAALRVREDASFPLDRPPGLGRRIDRASVEHQLGADLDQIRLELGSDRSDEDLELFGGHPVPRLGDLCELMAQVQRGDLAGALAGAGLDLDGWAEVGQRWGRALADDSALTARFRRRMAMLETSA